MQERENSDFCLEQWAHVYFIVLVSVQFCSRSSKSLTAESPTVMRLTQDDWMWNQWCNCLPVMSSQSTGDVGVPLLKHWLMCGADADMKRSAKAGLDALFLLLHFFILRSTLVNIFLYYKKKVCTVLLGGQVLLHFFKKKSRDWCPETWNVFLSSSF